MTGFAIGLAITAAPQVGGGTHATIRASLPPALLAVQDGQTLADTLPAWVTSAGNYSSTAGAIVSVVREWSVSGKAWTADGTTAVHWNETVLARITVSDRTGNTGVFLTPAVTVGGLAPASQSAPVLSGSATLGSTLTVSGGTWTGLPAPTLARQWMRNGQPIAGATSSTHTVVLADGGATLAVKVTATNPLGSTAATSAGLPVAAFAAPVNTAAPAISGSSHVGGTLSVSPGAWSGHPAPVLAYQWRKNGANIPGATSGSYVAVPGDAGATISCLVTATNAAGTASAASAGVEIVAIKATTSLDGTVAWTFNGTGTVSLTVSGSSVEVYNGTHTFSVADLDAGPVALVAPAIAGIAAQGETLAMAYPSLAVYTGTLSRAYRWQEDGSDLPGATDEAGHVVANDGVEITLEETLTDDNGSVTAESAPVAIPSSQIAHYGGMVTTTDFGSGRTATFSGLPVGPASPTKDVFVAFHYRQTGAGTQPAATIDGGTATHVASYRGNADICLAVFKRRVASGPAVAAQLVLDAADPAFKNVARASAWYGNGVTEHDTQAGYAYGTSIAANVDTVADGFVFAVCSIRDGLGDDYVATAGLVERYDVKTANSYMVNAAADTVTETAETPRPIGFSWAAVKQTSAIAVSLEKAK